MTTKYKRVAIIGGGTISHIRAHMALCAPAYGGTARKLERLCSEGFDSMYISTYFTKMAGGSLETNEDVSKLVDQLLEDLSVKVIFFNAALCDFDGKIGDVESGKYSERLKTKEGEQTIALTPADKIIAKIRKARKDIFLVGFKTTNGASEKDQYLAGLNLCKAASCNLVLANDLSTRVNMIITPEEAKYHVTTDREEVLKNLVEMTKLRSHLTFTRSTVVSGESISWSSSQVYETLRTVVNYCINKNAYKPFRGATVGHFACKIDEKTFLTSKRKTNFNDLDKLGLVKIETDGPDSVIAYGSKPSVGGQSQRIVFTEHKDYDCIVHFHCPIKEGSLVPTVSQREYECGSHECGQNTSSGLKQFGNLSAVYLDQHGPNIVFNHSIDPQEVVDFIESNFHLSEKTGGMVS